MSVQEIHVFQVLFVKTNQDLLHANVQEERLGIRIEQDVLKQVNQQGVQIQIFVRLESNVLMMNICTRASASVFKVTSEIKQLVNAEIVMNVMNFGINQLVELMLFVKIYLEAMIVSVHQGLMVIHFLNV